MFFIHDFWTEVNIRLSGRKDLSWREKKRTKHASSMHVIISLGFADKLFLLHSAVLKPNSNLAFWEVGCRRDASSLVFGDKLACCILLFQFFQLYLGVGNTLFAPSPITADFWLQRNNIWKTKSKLKHYYKPFATGERHWIWHHYELSI